MSADTTELETQVRAALGDAVRDSVIAYDELTILVDGARIVEVLTRLRDDPALRFVSFIDICGVDYPGREHRFDVVYHLLSPHKNQRIRVKVETDEVTPVPSVDRRLPGRRTGSSARPTTSTASCSRATRICAASSPTTASRAIRCARTSRSPASSRSATTTSRSGWSTSR